MIRLVSGLQVPKGTTPDTIFTDGKKLLVRVLSSNGARAEISAAGKIFTVLTKAPLEKGAELFVQVIRTENAIELKVLNRLLKQTVLPSSQLNEMLRSDPVLIKALLRTGISLKDNRIKRLKRILDEKGKKDDAEFARLLSIMEEKGISGLINGDSILRHRRDNENEDRRKQGTWKNLQLSFDHIREALLKKSDSPDDLSLFNHLRSSEKYNWMVLPVRISYEGTIFSGSLRVCIKLAEKSVSQGILKLKSENSYRPEEWCFGITDAEKKKLYLLKGPEVDTEKLDKFREKVRKQGFVFVDTKNRGTVDGFSPETDDFISGIDTEV